MASLEKDHSYSETSEQPEAIPEEYAVADVGISHRLRDRELLRKRRAEAEEKDTQQDPSKEWNWWEIYVREAARKEETNTFQAEIDRREQKKQKRVRKGRATGRGRGRRKVSQPEPQPELESEEAESHETQVATVEEKAEVTHGLHEECSVPLVVTEGLYSQEEIIPSVFRCAHQPGLEETSRPEESEDPQSLENDHLEQNLFGF